MNAITALLVALVRLYQLLVRPLLPPACRFTPSCSHYAIEALRTHGALRGVGLSVWRVVRCNPWCAPGHDPVPCGHPHADTIEAR